ncbi:hypothetical protein ONS95_007205 [Cadophora gregata]|uniref:uncharacterized protein n=1 Tax=Cadophora gregata TaxID=51156 RepID=UPI0026DBDC01|nr:uncharacterized protein ONS95_007205 [Cadophora gregata]KAK0100755.1 hypothetical protein ONS95_007205 [Cadophora gregata]KAK0117250.1 hypothetical protein ONS96_013083 [Cadophora gregata f. sp. sojae]
MKSFTTSILSLLLILLLTLQAVAIPTSDIVEASLPLDLSSDFIYRDPDNGALIPMNGTIEENLHLFKFDDAVNIASTSLESRNPRGPPDCHPPQNWKPVGEAPLLDGIDYLHRIKGDIRFSARSCGRVSCSWNAGIFLCNDNYVEWWVTASKIGDYAQNIAKACCRDCMGQQFDDANWNVCVASSPC